MAIWISCIIPDPIDSANRIAAVGGSSGWIEPEDTVIGEVEDGANYCVEVDEQRIDVVVVERDGVKYLTTDPDKTAENNLLFLPRCT